MNDSTTIAYADCFSGVSGDMLLGALLHVGLDEMVLREELAKLGLGDFTLTVTAIQDHAITARKVSVSSERRQELRTLPDLLKILERSGINEAVCRRSAAVFRAIATAEAKVHDIAVEKVHFHEIGALDTVIDVVGAAIGLDILGIKKLVASPLPLGTGFVQCAHGRLPLPAPAVCELLRGVPIYGIQTEKELVTPTGAALITILADEFGPMPTMVIKATGYGAGTHTLPGNQPNLLRLIIGEARQMAEPQTVRVIETHLDDWNSEGFPYLCEQLFAAGALDVSLTPLQMKKGRPGFCLQIICHPAHASALQELIFTETTTIGLRYREEHRQTLPREQVRVSSRWGEIAAKKVMTPQGERIYPEYESCREIAERYHVPLPEVYRAVICGQETKKC
jgi:pyridinium-3,5-bisthiocarboxylic acid mononucleotide nickel chelatase